MGLSKEALEREVGRHSWHHSIQLPHGVVTPGAKTLEVMSNEYDNTFGPIDLNGKTVLDVGAWSGAFSVEAARRGAAKVTALDYFVWQNKLTKQAFDMVTRESGYQIDTIEQDLDEPRLDLSKYGKFDVILFLGVFYHLRDPIAALREIALVTRDVLVLETYIETTLPEHPPAMMFYPGAELRGDPTNWWGPNISCVKELLTMSGFKKVDVAKGSAYNRYVFHAYP